MTAIEVFRKAAKDGCMLARPRKDTPGEYDCKDFFSGSKRGWVAVDSFTASAVVSVSDQLNETNRAKFHSLSLLRMVDVTWKLVRK